MNFFKEDLRKFVLVFFNDILAYSPSLQQHVDYLRIMLQLLRNHSLYAKLLGGGGKQVEYLGHVITGSGSQLNQLRLRRWGIGFSQLRGFIGLTGYYWKFSKGYGIISKPLNDMLKKDSFQWSEGAKKAFEKLKDAMSKSPGSSTTRHKQIIYSRDRCIQHGY